MPIYNSLVMLIKVKSKILTQRKQKLELNTTTQVKSQYVVTIVSTNDKASKVKRGSTKRMN